MSSEYLRKLKVLCEERDCDNPDTDKIDRLYDELDDLYLEVTDEEHIQIKEWVDEYQRSFN